MFVNRRVGTMKKIVLLGFLGFGCTMADEGAVDLANNAEPVKSSCNSAEAFNGLYGGLGVSMGQARHDFNDERFFNGVDWKVDDSSVLNKKKFAIDGELIGGYGRVVKDLVFFGAECRCGIGGKSKAKNARGNSHLLVSAFRPAILAVVGMYNSCCKSLFALTAGVRFMKMEMDVDLSNGFYEKKRSGVQLSLGARAERQFAQFGNRKVFGQMGVEYTFGRRKEVYDDVHNVVLSAETRRAMVTATVIVR